MNEAEEDSVKTLTMVVLVGLWTSTLIGWTMMFGAFFYFLTKPQYPYAAITAIPLLSQTLVVFAGWDEIVSIFGRWVRSR